MDEELKCKVCLAVYDHKDLKPRILPCLHVVCQSCLTIVLDMAVRGRNHPDDVIVLKCPVCRHTQPLQDDDINSFPVNKKIIQEISKMGNLGAAADDNDSDIEDEDLVRKFKHVSMDTNNNNANNFIPDYRDDPGQTRPVMPYGVDDHDNVDGNDNVDGYGIRQIELSAQRQENQLRIYPNVDQMVPASHSSGLYRNSTEEFFYNPGPYDMEEFDDASYIDDVTKQLGVISTDTDQRNDYQIPKAVPWANGGHDDDDVMAAIRKSCDEMYGGPVDIVTQNPDLVTDGPTGRFDRRDERELKRQHRFQKHLGRFGHNGHPAAINKRWHENYWDGDAGKGKSEEEVMLRQLQIEADKNPLAADVLEEMVRVKTGKEAESQRCNEHFDTLVPNNGEKSEGILWELKQQVKNNPTAATIAKEMEMVEQMRNKGYMTSTEDQFLVEQAIKESEKNPGTRMTLDKLLKSKTGSGNSTDDLIQDLMRASKNNPEAAILLDEVLSKDVQKDEGAKKTGAIEEPTRLIEEILRDRHASSEVKSRLITDIAAKASASCEKDETFTMLMTEAKENPIAAQILHDMLSGYSQ